MNNSENSIRNESFEMLIEALESKESSKWSQYMDYIAATALGQIAIRATMNVLRMAVNIVWWSCPHSEGGPPDDQLVRPLPWILFLPCLLWIRIAFLTACVVCHLTQQPRPRPASWVRQLQLWQRQVRYLRITGSRAIALADEPSLVDLVLVKLNGILDWFGLEMVVKDDQMNQRIQKNIDEDEWFESKIQEKEAQKVKPRTKRSHKQEDFQGYKKMIAKLKNTDKSEEHKARREEPTTESDSFSDGSFTLSSLSSPEFTSKDSNASPQEDHRDATFDSEFPDNAKADVFHFVQHSKSTVNVIPKRAVELYYPESSSGVSSMDPLMRFDSNVQEMAQSLKDLAESVGIDSDNEQQLAEVDSQMGFTKEKPKHSNSPRPRRQSVICEGTPSTPTITFSKYHEESDDDDLLTSVNGTSVVSSAVSSSVLVEKSNAPENQQTPRSSVTISKASSDGDLTSAMSKSKRRRLKKKQQMQLTDNKENTIDGKAVEVNVEANS